MLAWMDPHKPYLIWSTKYVVTSRTLPLTPVIKSIQNLELSLNLIKVRDCSKWAASPRYKDTNGHQS
jgi:hypothetical protein